MQTVSRVWSAVEVYVRALSFLLALVCVFSVGAPRANAADLSYQPSALMSAAAFLDNFVSNVAVGAQVVAEGLSSHPVHAQTAAVASASSNSSLTDAQMSAILGLLSSFGAEQSIINNVQVALKGGSPKDMVKSNDRPNKEKEHATSTASGEWKEKKDLPPQASICAVFARTLKKGAVGEDVAKLQEFLKQSGDFKELATSTYFGSLTEAALMNWQMRMQIATSGDAQTTGFGALGPKTRGFMQMNCASSNSARGELNATYSSTTPVCILRADKTEVTSGTSVTLSWESKNATYAGSATGEQMPPQGSLTVTPTETTEYVKKVYGPSGEGACSVKVEVTGSQTKTRKIVFNPLAPMNDMFRDMQLGAAVVSEVVGGAINKSHIQVGAVVVAEAMGDLVNTHR